MKTMTTQQKSNRDLSYISNVGDLQAEAHRLRLLIREQEAELREHFRHLPKEAMKAGVGAVAAPVLKNKAASIAIAAGSALVGNFFVKKAAATASQAAFSSFKKAGALALGRLALNWLFRDKKK